MDAVSLPKKKHTRFIGVSFGPVFRYPRCGLHITEPSVTPSGQRIGWVNFAMKNQDARALWDHWGIPVIAGPARDTMIFETAAPSVGPVAYLTLAMQPVREKCLLIPEITSDISLFGPEFGQQISMRAEAKAVN